MLLSKKKVTGNIFTLDLILCYVRHHFCCVILRICSHARRCRGCPARLPHSLFVQEKVSRDAFKDKGNWSQFLFIKILKHTRIQLLTSLCGGNNLNANYLFKRSSRKCTWPASIIPPKVTPLFNEYWNGSSSSSLLLVAKKNHPQPKSKVQDKKKHFKKSFFNISLGNTYMTLVSMWEIFLWCENDWANFWCMP